MGTITAQSLIDLAGKQLLDAGHVRYTSDDLLAYLNAGQRAIVEKKADANSVTEVVQLAAGTKQTIPAGSERLIEVIRNMGTDGATAGPAITIGDRKAMDRANPYWHTATADAEVEEWFYDPRVPKVYWVSPPQPASGQGYIEIAHVAKPADVANAADPITISDFYANALTHYMLFMAFSKDAKHPSMLARASNQWELFRVAIGDKDQAELHAETVVTDQRVIEGVMG